MIVKSSAIVLSLFTCLSGAVWVSPVWAEMSPTRASSTRAVKEIDRVINSDTPTYQALVQQAEVLAAQIINQELQNPQVETVVVRVSGDRYGNVAMLLIARVTRQEWQAKPNIRDWSKYAGQYSKQLLGYLNPLPPAPTAVYVPSAPVGNAPSVQGGVPAVGARGGASLAPKGTETLRSVNPLISGEVPEPTDPGYR
ncbi:MAG: hypothetical protein HC780_23225 [Leptolyngbyaceae cyanobacterium CSU_1_3]|nr:hypothetical protein [Leptolyngbyaceae cyanobacterium CSU_1_3]